LVKTSTEGEDPGTDLMEIKRPDGLGDIAALGLTLSDAKLLLANVQREIAAAQAGDHMVRRPDCPHCGGVCHVKDYRDYAVATLFGQVTMKLPRFRCARCGGTEAGIGWPSHCRSTPKLDRLRAHLSALMSYPVAAGLLEQLFPVDAGTDPETLRRHTLRAGEALAERAAIRPETAAPVIAVTLDSTSSGAVRTGSAIWRCGLAMPERSPVADRSSALSRKLTRTSRC
jgi:transposase